MPAVAKKFPKVQITVRVNPHTLSKLEAIGEREWKNRSEMIDRAIEEYVRLHGGNAAAERPASPQKPGRPPAKK